MTTIFLERVDDHCYRGLWRDCDLRMWPSETGTLVVGRGLDGSVQWEWTEPDTASAMERLIDQEDAARAILHDPRAEPPRSSVYSATPAAPYALPPAELAEGQLLLPVFNLAPDAERAPAEHVAVDARALVGVEYLRVGARTGSVVHLRDTALGSVLLAAIEPGAVLMRVFRAAPEEAARLAPPDDGRT